TPALRRLRYRATSTDVFPVPAEASRTTLFRGSVAKIRAEASSSGSSLTGSDSGDSSVAGAGVSGSSRCAVCSTPSPQSESCDARRRPASLPIANLVLPAHACVAASRAEEWLLGIHGERSALDSGDRGQESHLPVRQRLLER